MYSHGMPDSVTASTAAGSGMFEGVPVEVGGEVPETDGVVVEECVLLLEAV